MRVLGRRSLETESLKETNLTRRENLLVERVEESFHTVEGNFLFRYGGRDQRKESSMVVDACV